MIGTLFVRAFGDHLGITTHRDKELLVALGLSSSKTDRQTDRQATLWSRTSLNTRTHARTHIHKSPYTLAEEFHGRPHFFLTALTHDIIYTARHSFSVAGSHY